MNDFTLSNALELSVTGIFVVVFSLFMLMIMLMILGKILDAKSTQKALETLHLTQHEEIEEEILDPNFSGGILDLHDVDDRTAVMLMAIVADETKIPLNELVFKSIKEIKSE